MWPFRSSMSVEERILVWIRGRGVSWGADIADGLGIGSGKLYPALHRLEFRGHLASSWDGVDPIEPGKPRRRLYRLTVAGNGLIDPRAEARRQATPSPEPTPDGP